MICSRFLCSYFYIYISKHIYDSTAHFFHINFLGINWKKWKFSDKSIIYFSKNGRQLEGCRRIERPHRQARQPLGRPRHEHNRYDELQHVVNKSQGGQPHWQTRDHNVKLLLNLIPIIW